MALASAAAENAALSGITALAGYISLHSATTSTTGASELSGGSYARVAITWGSPSSGSVSNSGSLTINIPASTTAAYFGAWTASTSGTFHIGGALSPSITTGTSAGTVTFTAGSLALTAS